MSIDFYQAFEEKYRGSSELIQFRLRIYLPFIEQLIRLSENATAIDLGCGRGEWFEVLKELPINLQGVDIDSEMVDICEKKGFNVQKKDAVTFLKSLPSESVLIISGFHVAEHIAFSQLQKLVQESLRVLKPGGLLILETPNPENIVVATSTFYLDASHKNPIPPLLLSFLPEYYGFYKVKTLRLQAPSLLVNGKEEVTLFDVLSKVSMDYSIVAQKEGDYHLMAATSEAFSKNYGVELPELANKYDQKIDAKIQKAMDTIYSSISWKVTQPLRWIIIKVKTILTKF